MICGNWFGCCSKMSEWIQSSNVLDDLTPVVSVVSMQEILIFRLEIFTGSLAEIWARPFTWVPVVCTSRSVVRAMSRMLWWTGLTVLTGNWVKLYILKIFFIQKEKFIEFVILLNNYVGLIDIVLHSNKLSCNSNAI
jgi:hypothetical protein